MSGEQNLESLEKSKETSEKSKETSENSPVKLKQVKSPPVVLETRTLCLKTNVENTTPAPSKLPLGGLVTIPRLFSRLLRRLRSRRLLVIRKWITCRSSFSHHANAHEANGGKSGERERELLVKQMQEDTAKTLEIQKQEFIKLIAADKARAGKSMSYANERGSEESNWLDSDESQEKKKKEKQAMAMDDVHQQLPNKISQVLRLGKIKDTKETYRNKKSNGPTSWLSAYVNVTLQKNRYAWEHIYAAAEPEERSTRLGLAVCHILNDYFEKGRQERCDKMVDAWFKSSHAQDRNHVKMEELKQKNLVPPPILKNSRNPKRKDHNSGPPVDKKEHSKHLEWHPVSDEAMHSAMKKGSYTREDDDDQVMYDAEQTSNSSGQQKRKHSPTKPGDELYKMAALIKAKEGSDKHKKIMKFMENAKGEKKDVKKTDRSRSISIDEDYEDNVSGIPNPGAVPPGNKMQSKVSGDAFDADANPGAVPPRKKKQSEVSGDANSLRERKCCPTCSREFVPSVAFRKRLYFDMDNKPHGTVQNDSVLAANEVLKQQFEKCKAEMDISQMRVNDLERSVRELEKELQQVSERNRQLTAELIEELQQKLESVCGPDMKFGSGANEYAEGSRKNLAKKEGTAVAEKKSHDVPADKPAEKAEASNEKLAAADAPAEKKEKASAEKAADSPAKAAETKPESSESAEGTSKSVEKKE
ncbi:hypothetical protein DdX_17888 [Ditylenchus destructor]|uniref:Uncharacterized protein n=1 Tax=Ditylenchus destructor TaxID=166010 RepID=A0AAD4QYL7_9BILA|nr:hypothetical protein DdX_17888 [Ditylenchus destructor]